jgi:hypothetical protein
MLLIIAGGVTSELENFGCEIFEDSSEVDYSIRVSINAKSIEDNLPGAPAPTR